MPRRGRSGSAQGRCPTEAGSTPQASAESAGMPGHSGHRVEYRHACFVRLAVGRTRDAPCRGILSHGTAEGGHIEATTVAARRPPRNGARALCRRAGGARRAVSPMTWISLLGVAAVAAMAVLMASAARPDRDVRALWSELAMEGDGDVFDPATVAGLPDPARRFLLRAIAPGAPLARSVELVGPGTIRLAPDQEPPFRSARSRSWRRRRGSSGAPTHHRIRSRGGLAAGPRRRVPLLPRRW
jgi:hypothetical protein